MIIDGRIEEDTFDAFEIKSHKWNIQERKQIWNKHIIIVEKIS